MPVADWDFVSRRGAGPVPPAIVAAISAALRRFLDEERPPAVADPPGAWGLAGRREAVGRTPAAVPADLRDG